MLAKLSAKSMIARGLLLILALQMTQSIKTKQNYDSSIDDFISESLESLDNIDLSDPTSISTDDGTNNEESATKEPATSAKINKKSKEKASTVESKKDDSATNSKDEANKDSDSKNDEKKTSDSGASKENEQSQKENQVLNVLTGTQGGAESTTEQTSNLAKMNKVDFYLTVRGKKMYTNS